MLGVGLTDDLRSLGLDRAQCEKADADLAVAAPRDFAIGLKPIEIQDQLKRIGDGESVIHPQPSASFRDIADGSGNGDVPSRVGDDASLEHALASRQAITSVFNKSRIERRHGLSPIPITASQSNEGTVADWLR